MGIFHCLSPLLFSFMTNMASQQEIQRYIGPLTDFLARPSTLPGDKATLMAYLNENSTWQSTRPILPVDELQIRLQHMRILESRFKDYYSKPQFRFTKLQASVFLVMPLNELEARSNDIYFNLYANSITMHKDLMRMCE